MYKLINIISLILSKLSFKSIQFLSHLLAVLSFSILRIRRKLILKNLKIAFPEKSLEERKQLGYESIYQLSLTIFEFLRERHGRLGAKVTIQGKEHMEAALSQGGGAYILCFHMGSWEAMGGAITKNFNDCHVLVKKVGSGGINQFILDLRTKNGFNCIPRQKKGDGMKAIRNLLNENKIVGFVMDQGRPNSPSLPFFNTPAKTNTSFAAIWRKHPAPVIPAYITRDKNEHHTLTFQKPLVIETTQNKEQDIIDHSIMFNHIIESCVKKHPEQYFWVHDRWKV